MIKTKDTPARKFNLKPESPVKTPTEIVGFLGITAYPVVVRRIHEHELPTVECILKPSTTIRPPEVALTAGSRAIVEQKIRDLIIKSTEAFEDESGVSDQGPLAHVTLLHRQANLIERLGSVFVALVAVVVQADLPRPAKKQQHFDFGQALTILKENGRVARASWYKETTWLELVHKYADDLQYNSGSGKRYPIIPWIGIKTVDDKFVPWSFPQEDVLAEDWVEVI